MEIKGRHYRTGETLVLQTDGSRITAIGSAPADANLPVVAPGLIDLQINGFGGRDFNDPHADLDALVSSIWQSGTARFCPTLVTGPPDRLLACAEAIGRACARDARIDHAICGVHIEGPAISAEDGPRGAHPLKWVRPLSWDEFARVNEATGGRVRIVTLAPETPGALALIPRLKAAGVLVALGHTGATPEQIRAAVHAGARMSTHLGNGAHPILPRHPNYIWEQLAADELAAGAIADGHHLPAAVLSVIARVKGDQLALVSDAVRLAGMPPGSYPDVIGGDVVLTEAGRLQTAADPRILAGAARSLWDGVVWASSVGALSYADALEASSVTPARLLGFNHALEVGATADILLVDGETPRVLLAGQWAA